MFDQKIEMGSRRRSFYSDLDPGSTTSKGTSNNYGGSLEFQTSCSSAGKSQCSDVVSEVVEEENPMAQMWRTPSLKEFSFKDLKIATNNFSPDCLLHQGGFGRVYKGWVDEETLAPSSKSGIGMAVAIKILNPTGFQGFEAEVNFLGRYYHPNIISLFGYHWENRRVALVYEFMQNGSLENHLFGRIGTSLSWDKRLKIAIGAARGLAFLQSLEKKIIHGHFKASNILLDKNYNVKLSNFGFTMLGPLSEESPSPISTEVIDTIGYIAPECRIGNVYLKSDVYCYGIMLFELLTGSRAIDKNFPTGQNQLVECLKPILSQRKEVKTIMDVRMNNQYSFEAAVRVAQLSLRCLDSDPQSRPSIKEAVEELKEIKALKG